MDVTETENIHEWLCPACLLKVCRLDNALQTMFRDSDPQDRVCKSKACQCPCKDVGVTVLEGSVLSERIEIIKDDSA